MEYFLLAFVSVFIGAVLYLAHIVNRADKDMRESAERLWLAVEALDATARTMREADESFRQCDKSFQAMCDKLSKVK